MAISQELLEILACPKCKGDLELNATQDGLRLQGVQASLSNRGRHPDHVDRRGREGRVSDASARQVAPAVVAREPLTGWQRAVERLNVDTDEHAEEAFASGETAGARQFLWEPLRAFLAAVPQPARRERHWRVLAGYGRLACAAKLWEEEMRWRNRHLETFERGRSFGIVRREWRDVVEPLLDAKRAGDAMDGGRGGTSRVATDQGDLVLSPVASRRRHALAR